MGKYIYKWSCLLGGEASIIIDDVEIDLGDGNEAFIIDEVAKGGSLEFIKYECLLEFLGDKISSVKMEEIEKEVKEIVGW